MDQDVNKKIDNFFKQFKHQTFKKCRIFIRADEEPTDIFYLKKGLVKEYTILKKGEELIINIFKPISFFPMSWAINNTQNKYFYEAINDLDMWLAPKDEVINFIKSNPDVLYDLIKRVYKGTDGILKKMSFLMSDNAYAKLITELIIQAKRFGNISTNSEKTGKIELKISEKNLGAQAGITRETVSRKIKFLKDKDLVSLNKNILTIKNIKLLEEELNTF